MYRRQLGGFLLVLAVLTAMIFPPRLMAGQALSIDPLTVPRIGDCLSRHGAAAAIASTRTALVNDPNDSVFGPCGTGAVAGEVVVVWSAPPIDPLATGSSDVAGIAKTDCWRQAARFAGLDPAKNSLGLPALSQGGEHTRSAIHWRLQVDLHVELVVADSASRRIHRGWLACTVTSKAGALYTGRVGNAFGGGAIPPLFATCQASIDDGSASLPCTSPHPVESLALGDALGTTEDDSAWSCKRLAALEMRQDDPTENGQLIVLARRGPLQIWWLLAINASQLSHRDRRQSITE